MVSINLNKKVTLLQILKIYKINSKTLALMLSTFKNANFLKTCTTKIKDNRKC